MNQKRSPLSAEEQEKAKILYASGKTIHAVAHNLGRSAHTLKKFLCKPEIVKEVGIQREELAVMFDSITHRTLSGVTDEDVRKSSLLQKLTSAGISIDKALLLRNQPTAILDMRVLVDVAATLRQHTEESQEHIWRESHARLVPQAKDCIVANCPIHSLKPAPQAQPALPPAPQTEHPTVRVINPSLIST